MKILIVYTPRSKSTMLINILSKKFHLENCLELLTRSRRANQNFNEFPELIHRINTEDNICVKITGGNDFIDLKTCTIINNYKNIDYNNFDRVILLSRDNYVNAVLSYAYMDQLNDRTWHRQKGELKIGQPYTVNSLKIFYMLRGYIVYNYVRDFILKNTDPKKILEYEFESVETSAMHDFNLSASDFDIDLEDNQLDYKQLVDNPEQTIEEIHEVYNRMNQLSISDINNADSFFWKYAKEAIL